MTRFKENHTLAWMILGLLYSIMYVFGRMYDRYGYFNWDSNLNFIWLLLGAASGIPVSFVVSKVLKEKKTSVIEGKIEKKYQILIFLLNYICYVIILLGVFPGFFVYDAQDELMQVITRNFSAHHPMLHVLYLGGIIQAGYKVFGTYNAGIFIFSLFQALLFSYGNVRILNFMNKHGSSKFSIVLADLFLLLFPPMEMMVLCSTKDSIFALCSALMIMSYYEIKESTDAKGIIQFIFWVVCVCMFRNNAMYALIVLALVIVVFYNDKRPALRIVIGIITAVLLNNVLMFTFSATPVGKQEMLTVPIQQITRYHNYFSEEEGGFNSEERELLYKYLAPEYLNRYEPKVTDLVKYGFDNEYYKNDSKGFWTLWFKGLKSKPMCYFNGWMMTCYGFYYPNATIDAYKGHEVFTFTYDESSYFGYETEQPGVRASKIPVIDNYFRYLSLEKVKDDNMLLGLILSPGLITWMYLSLLLIMCLNKMERNEIPCIYSVLIIATFIIGPLCLPRYVFYLWYSLPIILSMTFRGIKKGEK